jgi:hypothetical protein
MADNKTKPTASSATAFLNRIEDPQVRADCFSLVELMHKASGREPVMWGSAIVGFGLRHYVYESGREGDTVAIGFSPRKGRISIYLTGGLELAEDQLSRLGKYKTGKGCLYIRSLADVNTDVLARILARAYKEAQRSNRQVG